MTGALRDDSLRRRTVRATPNEMVRTGPIALIESAYAVESTVHEWLDGLASAARVAFRRNVGAYALTYDASDIANCTFGPLVSSGIDSPKLLRLLRHDLPRAYHAAPQVVDAVFRKTSYGPSARLPLVGALVKARSRLIQWSGADILGLNGVNVDGRGLHIGVLVPSSAASHTGSDLLARLSSHLAAAFRLRAKLGADVLADAAAIIDARGRIAHATGAARLPEARRSLAEAAARIDSLRSTVANRDPERAVEQWRALVDARWSLVDHFEHDGKRYIVAHRNDPTVAPFALLTARERQVVALAALGHANKMIGYELGISVSTAGVLLSRAAKKLGTHSRAELIAAYDARNARRRAQGPDE